MERTGSALDALLVSDLRPAVEQFFAGRQYGWVVGPAKMRALLGGSGPVGWSPTVEETPETELAGPLYVFAETFAEELTITGALRAHGVPTYGYYAWMLPNLIASEGYGALSAAGEWRQTPAGAPLDTRYAVFCAPRTGSAYLGALLAEAGLGHPVEHLRGLAVAAVTKAGMPLERYLSAVEACDSVGGVFGTKLVFHDFLQACFSDVERARRQVEALREAGYVFFHLHRDVAASVVSAVLATASGVWHVSAAQLGPARALHTTAEPDLEAARRLVVHRLAMDALLARAAAVPADHRFDYEQLVRSPDAVVEAVLDRLSRSRNPQPTALRRPARLGADNDAYARWGLRLNERLLHEGEALLPQVRREASRLGGVDEREVARWPEIEAGVRRLLEQADRRVSAGADPAEPSYSAA